LGIVAASLLIVAAVLAIDMALTREVRLLGTGEIEKEPSFAALETGRSIMRNSTLLSGLYRVLRPVFSKAPDRQLGPPSRRRIRALAGDAFSHRRGPLDGWALLAS
jgi:hypothetical protein